MNLARRLPDKQPDGALSGVTVDMNRLHQHESERSELSSARLLGEAIRTIEGLSVELDRKRAELGRLRAQAGSDGKAVDASGVA